MIRAPHGTAERFDQGCDCEPCRCAVFSHGGEKKPSARVKKSNEWPDADIRLAKDLTLSNRQVADQTGRTCSAVRQFRDRMGWRGVDSRKKVNDG